MNKQRMTVFVILFAVVGIVAVLVTQNEREIGNAKGMIAQDFTLPMHGGSSLGQLSDYRGNVVVMNIWASWCEPCRDEMPALMDLQEQYEESGLSVVTVNLQTFERTLNDAPAFIEELGITLPVFFDENGSVADAYETSTGIPMTYIIDSAGVIEHVIRGEVTFEGLEQLIQPMLEEA